MFSRSNKARRYFEVEAKTRGGVDDSWGMVWDHYAAQEVGFRSVRSRKKNKGLIVDRGSIQNATIVLTPRGSAPIIRALVRPAGTQVGLGEQPDEC